MENGKSFEEYLDEKNETGQVKMDDWINWIESFTNKTKIKKDKDNDE